MLVRTIGVISDGLELEAELVVPDVARAIVVLCRGLPSGAPRDPADPDYPGLARDLAANRYAGVSFNFRGCYRAPGDFSIAGWCRDLDAIIDGVRAREEVRGLPIVLTGSSAGGAVVITVGARRADVDAVATLAAVASWDFPAEARDARALLQRFRNSGIIRDPAFPADEAAWLAEFETVNAAAAVHGIAPRPVLIVHGDSDDVVPYPHAERLFAAAVEPKELVRIPGGAHQLRRDERAIAALIDWLDRHYGDNRTNRAEPSAGSQESSGARR